MEDSGDESDDVYDQFDLGDFTKEEIKRYESMVGPGERLRDAASPEEPSCPSLVMPETTGEPVRILETRQKLISRVVDTYEEDLLGTSFTKKLPEELHDMLRAGLSNAIYRVVGNDTILPMRSFGYDEESELEIDHVAQFFMEELAKPAPQMERFIRHHQLRKFICDYSELHCLNMLRDDYGPRISVQFAHRIFEQEVYDFGRLIGLSKKQAIGHVVKAREVSSNCNIDLPELGDYESSECEDILNYLHAHSEQLLARSNSKEAKQVRRYLRTLKDNDSRSIYHWIMFRLQFNGEEPVVDLDLRKRIANMEAADTTKEDKVARKDARKTRRAELQVQKEARRQLGKKKSQKNTNPQAEMMPKEQKPWASNPECLAQVQPIEDEEKPLKRKKKERKLKSEPALPIQSEALSEEHDKHKRGKVDSEAQDAISEKAKKKRGVGPQHSPFFQRNSISKAKKDAVKKVEQIMGFQTPMIQ